MESVSRERARCLGFSIRGDGKGSVFVTRYGEDVSVAFNDEAGAWAEAERLARIAPTSQLYRVEFPKHDTGISFASIRDIQLDEAEHVVSVSASKAGGQIKLDGILTTIRAFCGDQKSLLGDAPDRWIDEPVIAHVLPPEHATFCSGRVIVAFYFQPDKPEHMRTQRPAYLVYNDSPLYGRIGPSVVFSA